MINGEWLKSGSNLDDEDQGCGHGSKLGFTLFVVVFVPDEHGHKLLYYTICHLRCTAPTAQAVSRLSLSCHGTERERERERERQTDRQTDRQTGRQADRQTDRQRQRERERQTDRQK